MIELLRETIAMQRYGTPKKIQNPSQKQTKTDVQLLNQAQLTMTSGSDYNLI